MATSAAARGEIQLHQRSGKALPEGWGIDSQGQPTTDAAEVLNGAMLTSAAIRLGAGGNG